MTFAVVVEGLEDLKRFGELKPQIERAALQAINKTARDARASAAKRIAEQVNFSATYLGPNTGRLFVAEQATRGKLEARIRARGRPTSLARFLTSESRGSGVTLQVKPGKATRIKRAFTVRLRAGSADIETKSNRGLAIRLRPGERLSNKIKQVQLSRGLVLLYGPSVQQVFLDNQDKGVAKDITPEVFDRMEQEFFRLLKL